MTRIAAPLTAVVLSLAALAAGVATAHAAKVKTVRDSWQVTTVVAPHLETDGNNLFRITPGTDRFIKNRVQYVIRWNNFSSVAINERAAMRLAAEPGTGMLLDRALTAAEAKRFTARTLFFDADVLIVHPTNPVCASGLTSDAARSIFDGRTSTWTPLLAAGTAWSDPADDSVHGYRPAPTSSGYVEPLLGITAYGALTRGARMSQAVANVAADPNAAALVRWSAVRAAPTGVCAVALDGSAIDDAAVRARTYPHAWTVSWVTARAQNARTRAALARFAFHLFGTRGGAYLATQDGRSRLR